MSAKDKFHDDSDLDQLAHDLDLDMDAPIGATFAAALREQGSEVELAHEEDIDLAIDDDGFLLPHDLSENDGDTATFESSEAEHAHASMEPADDDEMHDFAHLEEAERVTKSAKLPVSPPHEAQFADHADEAEQESPPYQHEDMAAADSEAAGQGLGFDYSFGSSDSGGDRPIPRISIHAFCTRTPLLGLMRTITKDRRMKSVMMDVFEGGIQAAINHYVNETTPNLLILEGSGEPRQLLSELDALAGHCDENVRVVVIGQTNDIRFYRELMRRGVSEYLVMPVDPVHLIRSISQLFTDPDAPFMGKTLAVTGVKGGVGASSIAHNLAWALSERVKTNATLVDLDLNFGTTGLDFNHDATATIADALMSPDRFDEAVMGRLVSKVTDRLSLFTAPATLDRTYNLDPDTYVRVLDQIRSSVPFVVLDMPQIWSDWFKSTLIGADEIVVVAAPDLASLRNGKNMIDFLRSARPNDNPPKLVLNMVGLPKRPEIPAKDFGQAIGVDPTMVMPFDAQLFGTAANNGQMIFDVAPDSKCSQALDQLAVALSGRDIQKSRPSILKKLMGR
ncbi:MAG: AAA family ATPase [Alphaproteobacteria bacterium]|nr:AAA family ATPase [Alphaproteobacteria bacterium]